MKIEFEKKLPPPPKVVVPVSSYVSPELCEELDQVAVKNNVSRAELIRAILKGYLASVQKEAAA